MTLSNRKWITAFGACVVGLCAWSVVSAQQAEPKADKPTAGPVIIRGESDRGVSAAIKTAVDKIPAAVGDATMYFRVASITGKKSAKAETVAVELEVQDKPFELATNKGGK